MRLTDTSLFIPIDIEAAKTALPDPTGLFPDAHSTDDDRSFYRPYADMLLEDPRMRDIRYGLGDLGLIAVQVPDVQSAAAADRNAYLCALLRYGEQLTSRAGLLPIEGSLEGGVLRKLYPGVSQEWATDYAAKLLRMRDVMRRTRLFEYAAEAQHDRSVQGLRARTVPQYEAGVRVDARTNKLKIIRFPRYPAIRQEAA